MCMHGGEWKVKSQNQILKTANSGSSKTSMLLRERGGQSCKSVSRETKKFVVVGTSI